MGRRRNSASALFIFVQLRNCVKATYVDLLGSSSSQKLVDNSQGQIQDLQKEGPGPSVKIGVKLADVAPK